MLAPVALDKNVFYFSAYCSGTSSADAAPPPRWIV
jgi:hypothetical protein